jgi:hypothetical protein
MRGRPFFFWCAVGGTSVLALTALNMAADYMPDSGLDTLRNYLIRRNG